MISGRKVGQFFGHSCFKIYPPCVRLHRLSIVLKGSSYLHKRQVELVQVVLFCAKARFIGRDLDNDTHNKVLDAYATQVFSASSSTEKGEEVYLRIDHVAALSIVFESSSRGFAVQCTLWACSSTFAGSDRLVATHRGAPGAALKRAAPIVAKSITVSPAHVANASANKTYLLTRRRVHGVHDLIKQSNVELLREIKDLFHRHRCQVTLVSMMSCVKAFFEPSFQKGTSAIYLNATVSASPSRASGLSNQGKRAYEGGSLTRQRDVPKGKKGGVSTK